MLASSQQVTGKHTENMTDKDGHDGQRVLASSQQVTGKHTENMTDKDGHDGQRT